MKKIITAIFILLSVAAYAQYPNLINNNLQVNGWVKCYSLYLDRLIQDTAALKIVAINASNQSVYVPKSYFSQQSQVRCRDPYYYKYVLNGNNRQVVLNNSFEWGYSVDCNGITANGYRFKPFIKTIHENYFTIDLRNKARLYSKGLLLQKDTVNVGTSSSYCTDKCLNKYFIPIITATDIQGWNYDLKVTGGDSRSFIVYSPTEGDLYYSIKNIKSGTATAGIDINIPLDKFTPDGDYYVWIRCETSRNWVFYPPTKSKHNTYFTINLPFDCTYEYAISCITNSQ